MTTSTDDLAAFAETARHAVAACAELPMPARAERLAADGLLGILSPEDAGGLGLDAAFAIPVMQAAGAGLLGYPLLESLLLGAAFGDHPLAADIVLGRRIATIAWAGTATLASGRLHGTVGRAPLAGDADLILVATVDGAALVDRTSSGVSVTAAVGIDLEAPEAEITLGGTAPIALLGAEATARLHADARILWSAAIQGAAEACLTLAVEHTSTRVQFGRPLVMFQVLRHALARQKLAAEHIRAALTRYTTLAAAGASEARIAGQVAFAAATRFGTASIESALQLHGGMGFTWDLPLHRHLRRIRTWEAQGDSVALHRSIAADLLRANA